MERGGIRPGETAVTPDPGALPGDARLVFIGRVRTPWTALDDCPKNVRIAREAGRNASLEIDAAYRPGLAGLEGVSHLVVLYWMDRSRRDLIVQTPRHAAGPRGVFSLRSPARPNPIAMGVVPLLRLDAAAGRMDVGMLDCLDGTPLLDLKPYVPAVDAIAGAAFG